ncbi:MAG: hypothetical protein NPIRA03_16630 [Nitrospirales bacterium]|nr:MAG: hypothetical protein NPIRA03_16630 [Nitrospirales bacterium]
MVGVHNSPVAVKCCGIKGAGLLPTTDSSLRPYPAMHKHPRTHCWCDMELRHLLQEKWSPEEINDRMRSSPPKKLLGSKPWIKSGLS